MLKSGKSLKSLLINNYHYVVLAFFILTNLFLIFRLGIATDDLWFRKVSVCSPSVIIQYFRWHFQKENGRLLAHIFTVLFLRNKATFWLWKIIMVFATTVYCVLIAKISSVNRSQYKSAVAITVFLFMTVISDIYTGSVYWLTGSFNYFFPVLILLTVIWLSLNKPTSLLLPVLGLLCGATMEQTGLMVIGWFLLILIDYIIKEKKFSFFTFVCIVTSAIGYTFVIFSPATNTRASNQGFQGAKDIFINILKVIRRNWIDNISVMFIMTITVISVCWWLYKFNCNKSYRVISVIVIVYLISFDILNYIFKIFLYISEAFFSNKIILSKTANSVIAAFWIAYLVVFTITAVHVIIRIYFEKNQFLVCATAILAVGSQIMMGISNFAPKRTAFSGISMLMFFVIYSLNCINESLKLSKSQRIQKLNRKKPLKKALICFACIFACFYQIVFFKVFGYMYFSFDSKKYYPLDSVAMTEETNAKEQRNIKFYSNPDSVWNKEYNLFDFSLYS